MIDIQLIRNNTEEVALQLARRGKEIDLKSILKKDELWRSATQDNEKKRSELKLSSKEIGQKKKAGEDASSLMEAMKVVRDHISKAEKEVVVLEEDLNQDLLRLPNLPSKEAPLGKSEDDNLEIRKWGDIASFDFEPLAHDDLGQKMGWMSAETGVHLAKSRFTLLRGFGAKLERALINFMLDTHSKNGYEEILPPFMANSKALTGTGQLPKFEEDLFAIRGEDLYLIPTAEVPLTNMHSQQVIQKLKKGSSQKFTAHTPCFRSEAGSYGQDTKGYIRQHQFNKVELFKLCHPDDSLNEHKSLTQDAESILQALNLPYRVVDLCTADLGFSASRTFDLEVWLPSQKKYREISSCSNFMDFQARRAGIRFKDHETKKNRFVHTINGSGLAVGRTLVAIAENFQKEDGSIEVPEVLRKYMNL